MDMSGQRTIRASRDDVWAALLDKDVLKACVPGCQDMDGNPDDGFIATVVQKVGPVKATFKGTVNLSDRVPPESLRLQGQGKGGAAGFAKGSADVWLGEVADGTRLDYRIDAKVGGKLAQLGSRIIDGFAHKMATQFFDRLQKALEESVEEDLPEATDPERKRKGWFKRPTSKT